MDFRAMPVQRHGLPQREQPGSLEITNPFADLASVNPCDGLVSQTFVKEVVRKNCGKVTVRLTLPENHVRSFLEVVRRRLEIEPLSSDAKVFLAKL